MISSARICKTCGRTLSLTQFYMCSPTNSHGGQSYYKSCNDCYVSGSAIPTRSVIVNGKKLCVDCITLKDLSEFREGSRGVGGRRSYCLPCEKVRLAEVYQKKKPAYKEQSYRWREQNRARYLAQHRIHQFGRVSQARASSDGTVTPEFCDAVYKVEICSYCNRWVPLASRTMDHVIALSNGGVHSALNIVMACFSCNASKREFPVEDWIKTLDNPVIFRNDFTVDEISTSGGDDSVLSAMLISTDKDDTVGGLSDAAKRGKINFLMKNRHGTPFEHNQMVFRVEAPIFVFREWHRHRIGISINEQSGRYVELPPMFYVPPAHRPLMQVGKPGAYEYVPGSDEDQEWLAKDIMAQAESQYASYQQRLGRGIAKEVARMSLGVNIYSSMYWTCNARSLMAFLSLRTNEPTSTFPSKPMWEIDACARATEEVFKQAFPLTHATYVDNGRVAP